MLEACWVMVSGSVGRESGDSGLGYFRGFGRFETWIHDQVADVVGADPAGVTLTDGLFGQ